MLSHGTSGGLLISMARTALGGIGSVALKEEMQRVERLSNAETNAGLFEGRCSVWMFYDDSLPLVMDDCLYYCVMEDGFSTSHNPRCQTIDVLKYANETGI